MSKDVSENVNLSVFNSTPNVEENFPTRSEEFSEEPIDIDVEIHTFNDSHQAEWRKNVKMFENSLYAHLSSLSKNFAGAPATTVLAELSTRYDCSTVVDTVVVKSELVKFRSGLGEMIYSLKFSIEDKDWTDDSTEEEREFRVLLGLPSTVSAPQLTVYFPVQETAVFKDLLYFSKNHIELGFLNDFTVYHLDSFERRGGWGLTPVEIKTMMTAQ